MPGLKALAVAAGVTALAATGAWAAQQETTPQQGRTQQMPEASFGRMQQMMEQMLEQQRLMMDMNEQRQRLEDGSSTSVAAAIRQAGQMSDEVARGVSGAAGRNPAARPSVWPERVG